MSARAAALRESTATLPGNVAGTSRPIAVGARVGKQFLYLKEHINSQRIYTTKVGVAKTNS